MTTDNEMSVLADSVLSNAIAATNAAIMNLHTQDGLARSAITWFELEAVLRDRANKEQSDDH